MGALPAHPFVRDIDDLAQVGEVEPSTDYEPAVSNDVPNQRERGRIPEVLYVPVKKREPTAPGFGRRVIPVERDVIPRRAPWTLVDRQVGRAVSRVADFGQAVSLGVLSPLSRWLRD